MNICLDTRILEEIAAGNKEQKEWLIKTYSERRDGEVSCWFGSDAGWR